MWGRGHGRRGTGAGARAQGRGGDHRGGGVGGAGAGAGRGSGTQARPLDKSEAATQKCLATLNCDARFQNPPNSADKEELT